MQSLNSRPIAYRVTAEPDSEMLTSGHFLICRSLNLLPESGESNIVSLSRQYEANRSRIRSIWQLWSRNYLNQLKNTKWKTTQSNLSIRQIVIYLHSLEHPAKWTSTHITLCFLNSNNVIQTIEINVNKQFKQVAVNRVIYLPVEDNSHQLTTYFILRTPQTKAS